MFIPLFSSKAEIIYFDQIGQQELLLKKDSITLEVFENVINVDHVSYIMFSTKLSFNLNYMILQHMIEEQEDFSYSI